MNTPLPEDNVLSAAIGTLTALAAKRERELMMLRQENAQLRQQLEAARAVPEPPPPLAADLGDCLYAVVRPESTAPRRALAAFTDPSDAREWGKRRWPDSDVVDLSKPG